MTPITAHLVYALMWAGFGAGHSLLARESVKRHLRRRLGAWMRLVYNAIAVLHVGAVLAVGWKLFDGGHALDLPGWTGPTLSLLHLAGWMLLAAALAGYDLGRLAGTRQIRAHLRGFEEPEDEALRTDGLHRLIRHPAYAAGFLVLWGRVTTDFDLATAVWGSLYLVIGACFEEHTLARRYGSAYAEYRAHVPAFVPWKGRAI